MRTVNLVTEVTSFINVLYTHLNGDVITILTQVIDTLNELCQVRYQICLVSLLSLSL